jgi:hypothetical protein
MTKLIMKAARELGIESKVHVLEDHDLNPLVTVRDGSTAVQDRINAGWLMESSLQRVKTILGDMHRMAKQRQCGAL